MDDYCAISSSMTKIKGLECWKEIEGECSLVRATCKFLQSFEHISATRQLIAYKPPLKLQGHWEPLAGFSFPLAPEESDILHHHSS